MHVRDSLPQPVWRTEQIRQIEQRLVAERKISLYQLMIEAGEAAFHLLQQQYPTAHHLWIFCGKGNNGGDGYVVARLAKQAGYQVSVAAFAAPSSDLPAAKAHQAWLDVGGHCVDLHDLHGTPDLIVDALLGIGPNTSLQGDLRTWIQFINRQNVSVLAIDLPSGINANTGMQLGCAVHADVTLSLVGLKAGLMTGEVSDFCGDLFFAPLGAHLLPQKALIEAQPYDWVKTVLSRRNRTAHKGMFGKVLLIGGDEGMSGAIRLASHAALRTGAGLVKIFTHANHQLAITVSQPECMLSLSLATDLCWASVYILGPGLGQSAWSQAVWYEAMKASMPKVIDADGLNWLSQNPQKSNDWVLTPHPGEAARLLQCNIQDVQADRFAAAHELQRRYGGVVLLKGAGTLITDGKHWMVCVGGNPGMASGGMGDVLAGIIGALIAQGLPLYQAACAGALIHNQAADVVANKSGERGMLASDIISQLHRLVNPERVLHDNQNHQTAAR